MPALNGASPTAVSAALRDTLISPNETDSNFEAANVVDGLFAISRSIRYHANVLAWIALVEHGDPDQQRAALGLLDRRLAGHTGG